MPKPSEANRGQRPSSSPAAADALPAELQGLERLDLGQLRVQYRNRTGRIAPARISRPLLLRVLAHQIHVEAFGNLRRDTRRMLDRLGEDAERSRSAKPGEMGIAGQTTAKASDAMPALAEVPFSLKPGTLLSREWQGRMETVMALEEGFAWNGKAHASLSAVAFAITGTKWNGHRFFGLRDRRKSAAPAEVQDRAVSTKDRRGARVFPMRSGSVPEPDRSILGAQP